MNGRTESAGPLSLVVKPADTVHADRFGPRGAVLLQIQLDDPLVVRLDDGSHPLGAWRWLHDDPIHLAFLRVARAQRDLPDGDARVHSLVCELLGALAAPRHDRRRGEPPGWLSRVRERVDDAFFERLQVRALARGAAVHPVYLAREFRRYYGCSITEHIRRRRIAAASAMLVGSAEPIALVAYRTGFADQSHLTRAFQSETGMTPARFRALGAGA